MVWRPHDLARAVQRLICNERLHLSEEELAGGVAAAELELRVRRLGVMPATTAEISLTGETYFATSSAHFPVSFQYAGLSTGEQQISLPTTLSETAIQTVLAFPLISPLW